MTLHAIRSVLCLMLAAGSPIAAAHAQSCSANPCPVDVSGTVTLNSAAQLALSSTMTTIAAPTAANFATGFATQGGPLVTVRANTAVRVVVSGGSANWTRNAALSPKPVGDLQWATTSGGSYVALTTGLSTTNLLSTAATAGASNQIFYRMLLNWSTDIPGTYELPVIFTLVSP